MTTYTLKDPDVQAWQWNGPKDNRGVVESYSSDVRICSRCNSFICHHGWIMRSTYGPSLVCPGDWIIKRGDKYEVLSDAEFRAKYEEG
jgi:hypothetical protein